MFVLGCATFASNNSFTAFRLLANPIQIWYLLRIRFLEPTVGPVFSKFPIRFHVICGRSHDKRAVLVQCGWAKSDFSWQSERGSTCSSLPLWLCRPRLSTTSLPGKPTHLRGVFWVVCRRFSVRALELVALRDETTPPPELTLSLLTQPRGDEYVLGRLNEEKELSLAS